MNISSIQNENLYLNVNGSNNKEDDNTSLSEKSNKHLNAIYAGDLNENLTPLELKKQQAQKNAMKAIMDQYANDSKTDDVVSDLHQEKKELIKDLDFAASEVKNLESLSQELKEANGITDDSAEQKDLELLEKSLYTTEELSEDEQSQLQNMGPLTDYQKAALQYDAMEKIWQQRVDNAKNGITGIAQTITGIGLSKLKTHPMVDAQKEAAQIIENASKEIVNTLLQQVKDNTDQKIEENKENAEKQQEAKEKQDVANNSSTDESNKLSEAQADQLKLLDDLKRYADKNNLLDEDIKGIVVDEQV